MLTTTIDEDGPEAEVASSNGELPGEAFYNKYAQLPRGKTLIPVVSTHQLIIEQAAAFRHILSDLCT